MSEIIEVSSEWLALREQEDARARSRELALAASGLLATGSESWSMTWEAAPAR